VSASSSVRSIILRISVFLDFKKSAVFTVTVSSKISFSMRLRNALTASRHLEENVSHGIPSDHCLA
jgi:hypothetical protein